MAALLICLQQRLDIAGTSGVFLPAQDFLKSADASPWTTERVGDRRDHRPAAIIVDEPHRRGRCATLRLSRAGVIRYSGSLPGRQYRPSPSAGHRQRRLLRLPYYWARRRGTPAAVSPPVRPRAVP